MIDKEIKIGTIIISPGAIFTTKHLEEISRQFKQLEAENKELKEKYDALISNLDFEVQKKEVLEDENAKLKEYLKMYQFSDEQHLLKVISIEQILTKIKEIVETCNNNDYCPDCKFYTKDVIGAFCVTDKILQVIIKAESESTNE